MMSHCIVGKYLINYVTEDGICINREAQEDEESQDEEVDEGECSHGEGASDDSEVGLEVHELQGANKN